MDHKFIRCLLALLLFNLATASLFAITGISAGVNPSTGARPFRQEFSTFQTSGPAFDLYIQALQNLTSKAQSEKLSYFQVAGMYYTSLLYSEVADFRQESMGTVRRLLV